LGFVGSALDAAYRVEGLFFFKKNYRVKKDSRCVCAGLRLRAIEFRDFRNQNKSGYGFSWRVSLHL